jgi:hypothetical protein
VRAHLAGRTTAPACGFKNSDRCCVDQSHEYSTRSTRWHEGNLMPGCLSGCLLPNQPVVNLVNREPECQDA